MPGADAEVGGREHDRVGGLADVVLVDDAAAFVRRFGQDKRDGGRGAGDVPGAPPDRGQLAQLGAVGDDDEVPVLAVGRRGGAPAGFEDAIEVGPGQGIVSVGTDVAARANSIPGLHMLSFLLADRGSGASRLALPDHLNGRCIVDLPERNSVQKADRRRGPPRLRAGHRCGRAGQGRLSVW